MTIFLTLVARTVQLRSWQEHTGRGALSRPGAAPGAGNSALQPERPELWGRK